MKYVVKERQLLNFNEGDQIAVEFIEFAELKYGKGIVGKVVDADGELVALIDTEVIIPLRASLEGLDEAGLVPGDVIAFKNNGMKKSKSGYKYVDVRYTIYRKKDYDELMLHDKDKVPF